MSFRPDLGKISDGSFIFSKECPFDKFSAPPAYMVFNLKQFYEPLNHEHSHPNVSKRVSWDS